MPQHTTSRRPQPSPAVTAWALVGVIAVVGSGIALRLLGTRPLGVDRWWHGAIAVSPGSGFRAIAVFFAEAGSGIGAAACTAIACALLLALRRRRDAAAVASALVIGVACSELIKAVTIRTRPWEQLYASSGTSFPSGHSMGAAALAVSLALVITHSTLLPRVSDGRVWSAACAWITLMMWSRTALHVHWLTDTIAGAMLGASVAVLSRWFWFREPRMKRGSNPPARK